MSWRKKKKELKKIKHKAWLIICLMFAVVIGLIIFLTIRIANSSWKSYKVESRVEQLKKTKPIEDSDYKPIAWLKVQGTNIDLPIVYSKYDGDDFPVQLESFAWTLDEFNQKSTYYDITGHNIFNLSSHPKIKSDSFNRFESLMAFVYYDFAKDNEYIHLTIDDKDYIFKIFSVSFTSDGIESFFPLNSDASENEIGNLIGVATGPSLYKYDVDVNKKDKIISLSTCTRFYGINGKKNFYVIGRLLRDGENIEHYRVTKSKNYKDVEKILKGDENNE